MIREVEFDGAVGVASDISTSVLGGLVMPDEWSVTFGEGVFEELNDGDVGGEDLAVVNMHDKGTLLCGVGGIMVVIHRGF